MSNELGKSKNNKFSSDFHQRRLLISTATNDLRMRGYCNKQYVIAVNSTTYDIPIFQFIYVHI